jgi:hypothetical protein
MVVPGNDTVQTVQAYLYSLQNLDTTVYLADNDIEGGMGGAVIVVKFTLF